MIFKRFRNKGQVFPFLLAALAVVIIIAMITVNLGQIGIFKTDVSNAADAGALAAASTLSGYLLGIGLLSDQMMGLLLTEIVTVIIFCITVIGVPAAIIDAIAIFVKQMINYFKALNDGKMAWGNAKKSALQYAFSNAGIDEPRPTFGQFVKNVYGLDVGELSVEEIKKYNDIYTLGDDPAASIDVRKKIKKNTQSGFATYMEESYYWDENIRGKIEPGVIYPGVLTSGYGWTVNDQGGISNSYPSKVYKNYENYVEVTVNSAVMYPLQLYNPVSQVYSDLADYIKEKTEDVWYLKALGNLANWVLKIVGGILKVLLPGGLKLEPIKTYTDNNPITVIVRRFKRNKNLGLWNFRYGVVQATAVSHVYGEDDGDEVPRDIKPLLSGMVEGAVGIAQCLGLGPGAIWCLIAYFLENGVDKFDNNPFDTTKHLFEVELISTY
jgi:hypothetical protein